MTGDEGGRFEAVEPAEQGIEVPGKQPPDQPQHEQQREEPGEEADEQLLAELRELARTLDPAPGEVVFAARGSLAWRRIDADLAEVSFDSSVDRGLALSGVRGGDNVRLVSFEGPDLTVEVEIARIGDLRRLVGQLVPPQPAPVEIRTAAPAQPDSRCHGG